ncbi:hypothetical protein SOPEG_2917 [Candidatus Sodalis pierantonius str. SOPE]|uniref:Stress-induced protein n=1 Tax=Candidatus Sodalis pierantonii str. SOPE TaxID=2342 RepID=W0HKR7_9GAMM|nr:KGG domain-containing protein [Candidatus Sodalis pierantonius]AHF74446.1 hypothetical protein SOPEG_2917 [Candidatus Sodalis pierantonius str. SOPE]
MAEHRGGSGNFAEDKQKASEAGRKGGQSSSSSSGGNFKNDPQKASEAGKKSGQHSHSVGRNA